MDDTIEKADLESRDATGVNGSTKNSTTNIDDSNETTTKSVARDPTSSENKLLSKNQQKKLKRKQEWEEGREARKVRRREKTKEKKQRKRDAREQEQHEDFNGERRKYFGAHAARINQHRVTVPLTVIYDCDFDTYMSEEEIISLGNQITRAYSDNKKARYRAHIVVSSFSGRLKERFDGLLQRNHESWRGMRFMDNGWEECAELARGWMIERESNAPAWAQAALGTTDENADRADGQKQDVDTADSAVASNASLDRSYVAEDANASEATKAPELSHPTPKDDASEVIYLTSDSPNTLDKLQPRSVYVIGGIVDKNRHKGLCYKRACDAGFKTAKLPIGEYLKMSSRAVLTTNQVGEIMLKWLECGDWGQAFVSVIPGRKGAILKYGQDNSSDATPQNTGDVDEEVVVAVEDQEHEQSDTSDNEDDNSDDNGENDAVNGEAAHRLHIDNGKIGAMSVTDTVGESKTDSL